MKTSTDVTIFKFKTDSVRTIVDEKGEIWFVAADICSILDIANTSQAISRLDEDEVKLVDYLPLCKIEGVINQQLSADNLNSNQKINIISESGMYTLILRSNKPEAKAFKRWVTREVLPSIRKTGKYEAPEGLITLGLDEYQTLFNSHEIVKNADKISIADMTFKYQDAAIRSVRDEAGEVWFVLKDILEAMGRKGVRTNEAQASILEGLGKGYIDKVPLSTPGGTQEVIVVNDPGVTFLCANSRTEQGRKLNRWLHVEILPSIRKTGKYELPEGKVMLDKEDYQQLLNDSVIIPRTSMYIMMCIEEYLHVRPKDVRGAVGYALGDLAKNVRDYHDTVLSDPVAKELDKIIDFLHRPLTEYDVALINIEDLRAYFGFQKAAMQQHLIRAGLLDDNLKLTAFGAGLAQYIKGELWMIRKDTLAHFIEYAKARKNVMVQLRTELGILK